MKSVDVTFTELWDGTTEVQVYKHGKNVPSIWNKDLHRSTGLTPVDRLELLAQISKKRRIINVWRKNPNGFWFTIQGEPPPLPKGSDRYAGPSREQREAGS